MEVEVEACKMSCSIGSDCEPETWELEACGMEAWELEAWARLGDAGGWGREDDIY